MICQRCGQSFVPSSGMLEHIAMYPDATGLWCADCDEMFIFANMDMKHDLYIDPGHGLLPTGEWIEDMD